MFGLTLLVILFGYSSAEQNNISTTEELNGNRTTIESTTLTAEITTEGVFTDWTIPPSTEQTTEKDEEEIEGRKKGSIRFIESGGYVLHRSLPNGEQYMLLRRKGKRKWWFPQDFCQKGENASQTALRILTNTTGLTADDVSIIPNLEKIITKGRRRRIFVTTFFIATLKDLNKELVIPPEFTMYEWMFIKEAGDNVNAEFVEALEDIHKFVTNIIKKIPKSYPRT